MKRRWTVARKRDDADSIRKRGMFRLIETKRVKQNFEISTIKARNKIVRSLLQTKIIIDLVIRTEFLFGGYRVIETEHEIGKMKFPNAKIK